MIWLLCTLALAGTREDAELERYIEDLNSYAEQNLWDGVERRYVQIMEMEDVDVPRDVHMTAAQAARATGDMDEVLRRLRRAQAMKRTDEVASWISQLEETYGPVELRTVPPRGVELSPTAMPFEPDKRLCVEKASSELDKDGEFVGLLPVGTYQIGGTEFQVIAGVTTRVELSSKELRNEDKKRPE